MTPEERTAFQTQMRSAKTYDECKVSRRLIGPPWKNVPRRRRHLAVPRQNGCDVMKSRGLIK